MTYSMLLIQRNGMPDHAKQFLYDHAKAHGFSKEQVKVYRYYYKPAPFDKDDNVLCGVTDDVHASHFLYVLDFKNDKDRFLYSLRCDKNNIVLFDEYYAWNKREVWANSLNELIHDGYLGGNNENA